MATATLTLDDRAPDVLLAEAKAIAVRHYRKQLEWNPNRTYQDWLTAEMNSEGDYPNECGLSVDECSYGQFFTTDIYHLLREWLGDSLLIDEIDDCDKQLICDLWDSLEVISQTEAE